MADIRSRLAALRARREQRSKPSVSSGASSSTMHLPEPSWDMHFKQRLTASALTLSDDEEDDELDELIVLPPPTVKLDPSAQRVVWRREQHSIARKKAHQLFKDRYPAMSRTFHDLPTEKDANTNVVEVQNEEELLVEEEVDDEEQQSDDEQSTTTANPSNSHVEHSTQNESLSAIAQEKESATCVETTAADDAQVHTTDTTDDGAGADHSLPDVSHNFESKSKPQPTPTTSPKKALPNSALNIEESCSRHVDELRRDDKIACPSPRQSLEEDREDTRSGHSRHCATQSPQTASEIAQTRRSEVTSQPDGLNADPSLDEAQPSANPPSLREAQQTRGASLSFGRDTAFIDDEAEEENDGSHRDDNEEVPALNDSDSDKDVLDATVVVDDTNVGEDDAARLASFHRKWERNSHGAQIAEIAKECNARTNAARAVAIDVDNAMDLTELVRRDNPEERSQSDDAASQVCVGLDHEDKTSDVAENYVDAM